MKALYFSLKGNLPKNEMKFVYVKAQIAPTGCKANLETSFLQNINQKPTHSLGLHTSQDLHMRG